MTNSRVEKRDLRLEMRVKNNILWHAIRQLHSTISAFCKNFNINASDVSALLCFKTSPFTKKGDYRRIVWNISEATGIAPNQLFPAKIYAEMLKIGSFKAVEVSSFAALPRATRREIRLLPAPIDQNPEAEYIEIEKDKRNRIVINTVLKELSYREREIIKLRFGLFGYREHSLDEIGEIFKLSKEMVRRIEAKAIRKLQQPSKSSKLVVLLD